jgi:uncharacterized membrane protein
MAQSLDKFIVGVVIIGITLVIAMFIAATIQDATYDDGSGTIANETITGLAIAGDDLAVVNYKDVICSNAVVINATTFEVLTETTDYVVTNCNIVGVALSDFLDEDVKVSYSHTYTANSATSNASGDLVTSLSGGSAWITILIVVGFATIVLGMLTSGLGKSAEQESAFTY